MASYLIIYACNKLYRTARASMAVRAERLASVDQYVESDADDENPGPSTSKKQKMSAKSVGAAKYRTKFQKEWLKVYPFVQEVKDNPHKFLCNICMRQVACDHQGKHDIERHMEKAMHQANVKQMKGQTTLGFQVESSPINEQVIRAEVKVAHMLAQHNVPLSLADELTPLFHDIFPDSDIAKNFSSRRTKTACILNGAIAPVLQQNLVNTMKTCPFTLAIDGSTDTGVEKMNPLTVRIFNAEYGMVHTQFLDMCMSSQSTAEGIFTKMEEALQKHEIPWLNCVGVGVDNTSVNMGCNNSIMTRLKQVNASVYVMGCPCHIIHNTAGKSNNAFQEVSLTDMLHVSVKVIQFYILGVWI